MPWLRHNIVLTVMDEDEDEPRKEAYNSHSRTPSGDMLGGHENPENWAVKLVDQYNARMVPQGYPKRKLLHVEVL